MKDVCILQGCIEEETRQLHEAESEMVAVERHYKELTAVISKKRSDPFVFSLSPVSDFVSATERLL